MFSAAFGARSRAIASASTSVCQEFRQQLFPQNSSAFVQIRTATKRGGGSTKNGRDSSGKRLGAKKYGGEYVVPGNILMRQRGQKFRPGQHVGMGRDHTLVALQPGYVVYYEHHLPYPHQSEPKLQPPKSMEMFKVGGIDDGSKVMRKLAQPEEMPMVKFPRAMKRYIGIVRTPEETLPRDEREEGRERFCWTTDGKEDAAAAV